MERYIGKAQTSRGSKLAQTACILDWLLKQTTMIVLIGESDKDSKEDAILKPDIDSVHKVEKHNKVSVGIGVLIGLLTGMLWAVGDTAWLFIYVGFGNLIFFHGLLCCFQPLETYDLEITIDGYNFKSNMFPRQILFCAINITIGINGLITMV